MSTLGSSFVCAIILTLASLTGPRAESPPASLPLLKQWAGKYPFDKVKGKDFWSTPGLREALTKVVGPGEYNRLIRFSSSGPAAPVEAWGAYVFADACKAHDCHDERFNLIINTEGGQVFVCRATAASSARGVTLWSTDRRKNVESKQECTNASEDGPRTEAYFKRALNLIPSEIRPTE